MGLLGNFLKTLVVTSAPAPFVSAAADAPVKTSLPSGSKLDSAKASPAKASPPPAASPELEDIDVSPRETSIAVGATQQFTATAVYVNGTKRDVTKHVVWVSTSAEDVSIDENGLATAHRARGVRLTARDPDTDWRGYADVEVPGDQSQVLNYLKFEPAGATIESGKSQQFTLTGGFADGSTKVLTKSVVWSSSDETVVTINEHGLATAKNLKGTARIYATDAAYDAREYVNVTVTVDGKGPPKAPKLTSITISPAKAAIASGAQQQFTATGLYANKTTKDLTKLVSWSSGDDAVLLIDPDSGLATAQRGKGTARIEAVDPDTAIYGKVDATVTGDAPAVLQAPVLQSITIEPAQATVAAGGTQQFKALAVLADGSSKDVTTSIDWLVNNLEIMSIDEKGLATAKRVAGTVEVNAMDAATGMTSAPAKVTVTAVVPPATPIAPVAPDKAKGQTTGGLLDPFVEQPKDGSSFKSITLSPARIALPIGKKQQLSATGEYADGSKTDLTKVVKWISADPDNASVGERDGLATGLKAGPAMIRAEVSKDVFSDFFVSVHVTADEKPVLMTIDVSPKKPTLVGGQQLQLKAMGTFSDDSTQDVTTKVRWGANNYGFVWVDDQGLVTAKRPAKEVTVKISAADPEGRALDANVELTLQVAKDGKPPDAQDDATLEEIWLKPENPALAIGAKLQIRVFARYSDERSDDVTNEVVWIYDRKIVDVTDSGLLTALAAGGPMELEATYIQADKSETIGSTEVTVTAGAATNPAPFLKSLGLGDVKVSMVGGEKQQFSAMGEFSDGSTRDVTTTVIWSSSAPDVLSVGEKTGLATAGLKAGSATITAADPTQPEFNITVVVKVTKPAESPTGSPAAAPVLKSLAWGEVRTGMFVGKEQQLIALGAFADGSEQDFTKLVVWRSSAQDVLSIDEKTGLAKAGHKPGKAQITATHKDTNLSVTEEFTVAAPVLQQIRVEPDLDQLAFGGQQQLKAMGVYSDDSRRDLTATVRWGSEKPALITVDPKGLATAKKVAGLAVIKAMDPDTGISGSWWINVSAQGAVGKEGVLQSLGLNGATNALVAGQDFQFRAEGVFSDGSSRDVTEAVDWSSSDRAVVDIVDYTGVATGGATPGTATITATHPDTKLSRSIEVSVTDPVLKSMTVESYKNEIMGGGSETFYAQGMFDDGSGHELAGRVVWSSLTPNILKINETTGKATAQGVVGTAKVQAKDKKTGIVGTGKLEVKGPAKGAKPIDVQILVKNFKGEEMFDGTSVRVKFDAHDAEGFEIFEEIHQGVLDLPNLLLMPKGELGFKVLVELGESRSYLIAYDVKGAKTLTFSADQKPKTAKVRAKSEEEAVKKAGAVGRLGRNIDANNLGSEVNGESEWQVTWGSEDFEVKQI